MKITSSRRLFLRNSAIAATGITILSSSGLNAFTKTQNPYKGYNPYAEISNDFRSSKLFGNHITVKGKIYSQSGIVPLSDVKVEVWHLSPNFTKYRHRGILTTNNLGEYQFITDFPNKENGKIARIFYKITSKNKVYFTELLLTKDNGFITSKHWEENQLLEEKIFPKKEEILGQSTITLNISI
jgi:hypothetical protein